MQQNFTPNHLVRFLYKETSVAEGLAIREAMQENIGLLEAYAEMTEACRQLPKVTFRPSEQAIQRILQYSQCTAVQKQA